jgi:hypothetical protein
MTMGEAFPFAAERHKIKAMEPPGAANLIPMSAETTTAHSTAELAATASAGVGYVTKFTVHAPSPAKACHARRISPLHLDKRKFAAAS